MAGESRPDEGSAAYGPPRSGDCSISAACRLKDVAPQRLVVAAVEAPADNWGPALEALLARVWTYLNTFESVTVGPPMVRWRAIRPGAINLQAGFPAAEPIAASGEFEIVELQAGRAATLLHTGPYERLDAAIDELASWCGSQDLRIVDTPWLVFWVTPDEADDARDYRTEIVWPIARRKGE